jgi:ribosomal protein S18 acetylase RimI-like enzyme
MIQNPNLCSTIRGDSAPRPVDEYSMHSLYDGITHPATIVVLISAYFALFNKDILEHIVRASDGEAKSILHLILVLLALVVGIRVIHSIYLAKRDYRQLEIGFWDVILFLVVLVFTSGALVSLLKGKTNAILWVYTAGASIATINFIVLYSIRIPSIATTCDYPIERRIQAVNSLIFAALTVLMTWAAIVAGQANPKMDVLYWLVGGSIILLVVNILHSEQLTMHPKFLMHNQPDSVQWLIEVVRLNCGAMLVGKSDEELMAFFSDLPTARNRIHTVRATRAEAGVIGAELQRSFPYMFEYLFNTAQPDKIARGIQALLTVAGGLGTLGYMHFYFICNEGGERVGFFKIDTARGIWLYRPLEWIAMSMFMLFNHRSANLVGFVRRARLASAGQATPEIGELQLTYLVIFPEHQNRGYGSSFLRMLEISHLHNNTNYVVARRIVAGIRESNVTTRQMFEKAGYIYVTPGTAISRSDLFAGQESPGGLLKIERRLGSALSRQN